MFKKPSPKKEHVQKTLILKNINLKGGNTPNIRILRSMSYLKIKSQHKLKKTLKMHKNKLVHPKQLERRRLDDAKKVTQKAHQDFR